MLQKKENFPRTVKNLFLYVENVLVLIKEVNGKIFDVEVMTYIKRFFIHGFHLIRNLYQMLPTDETKHKEVCKSFQMIFSRLEIPQFRDLLHAAGDEIFGLIVEEKAKGADGGGLNLLTESFMKFKSQSQNP